MENTRFINNIKTALFIIIGIILIGNIHLVKAGSQGDTEGGVFQGTSGCTKKDSCWISIKGEEIAGIRVTIVDGNGNMVSEKSMDYLTTENKGALDFINKNKTYYRCINQTKHKLAYIKGTATCSWGLHDGTTVAKVLNWLPHIYDAKNTAETIKKTIMSMNQNELERNFLNDIGYNIANNRYQLENHYLIIEPLTAVRLGTPKSKTGGVPPSPTYYGTYHELAPKLLNYSWTGSLAYSYMPISIYSVGNEAIKGNGGYNKSDGTYFNGLIKIVKNEYFYYNNKKKRYEIYQNYRLNKDSKIGFGIGIYWMGQFETTSDTCDFTPSIVLPSCSKDKENDANDSSYGNIKFNINWDCIYESEYSNNEKMKNYFLKYKSADESCSVFCKDEITTFYPDNNMVALAGNYFTIGGALTSYSTYIDNNIQKIKNANLGPLIASVSKECRITGIANQECKNAAQQQLNELNEDSAPKIEFTYQSNYYNNPSLTLNATYSDETSINDNIYQKTANYSYLLPDSSSSYRYISKNTGISYKVESGAGSTPVVNIGPHLPIHFSEKNGQQFEYQIAIKKFNIDIFDDLILNGNQISTNFTTSIETYIKTLIDSNKVIPQYINGIYYLNNNFIKLLNINNYDTVDFLKMPCANTKDYNCYANDNGIYCYDKGTTTNSENTYILFNACINDAVAKIANEKANYKSDMLYKCYFSVENDIDFSNGSDIIFRPISLDNPFPSIDADGRETGSNWCYGDDCSNNNDLVNNKIINNRNVKTEEIYKELDPLYKITLTPSLIKEIRKYNNKTTYDDFNFECDSDGNNCKSQFIRETANKFSQHFSGCGISSKSNGLRCQDEDKW